MTRHELRERIFQTIFQLPFYDEEIPEIEVSDVADSEEISDKDKAYIEAKVAGIRDNLEEIDKVIEQNSNGWKVKRIGKSELAILRLAVYEIRFDADVPDKVAINEAVELAKSYSDEKAARFINGVLSGVVGCF